MRSLAPGANKVYKDDDMKTALIAYMMIVELQDYEAAQALLTC